MIGCPHPDFLPPDLTQSHLNDWDRYSQQVGYRQDFCWAQLYSILINQYRERDLLSPLDLMPYRKAKSGQRKKRMDTLFDNLTLSARKAKDTPK